jgi:hypothetical protein
MTVGQKTTSIFSLNIKRNRLTIIILSLVLASITHLLNPVGFPDLFYDEGVYIGKALHFLQSDNPQEGYFHGHDVYVRFSWTLRYGLLIYQVLSNFN